MDTKNFYEKKYAAFESLPGYRQEKEYCDRIIKWMRRSDLWPAGDQKYLDAGCGFGLKTYIFSEAFNVSLGIDFSNHVVEICNLLNNKPGNLSFKVKEIENYSGNGFDLVTAFGLSYFNEEKIEVLSERIIKMSASLLNSQGVLFIATRAGSSNQSGSGWHDLSGAEIARLKSLLKQKLAGYHIQLNVPDQNLKYLLSGSFLQFSGSLRKSILNKPRDLFIIIKNG